MTNSKRTFWNVPGSLECTVMAIAALYWVIRWLAGTELTIDPIVALMGVKVPKFALDPFGAAAVIAGLRGIVTRYYNLITSYLTPAGEAAMFIGFIFLGFASSQIAANVLLMALAAYLKIKSRHINDAF